MRSMRIILTMLLMSGFAFSVCGHQPITRIKARVVIKRTAAVIIAAHHAVKQGKVYTGKYARAVAHQRYAKLLFARGNFLRAIHHSRYARLLAVQAIKENKGVPPREAAFTAEEEGMFKNLPPDSELDAEIKKENPKASFKDEESLGSQPDVDVE